MSTHLTPASSPPVPVRPARRRRWPIAAVLGLLASAVAALGPFAGAHADQAPPPVVGSVAADSAPNGFARPTVPAGGPVPGYVYAPTGYDGTAPEPQPDDTYVGFGGQHVNFTGSLRTRNANGRDELLVCAHVGTNTPDDALTPFPTTGANAHPATIAPRVQVIAASGATDTFDFSTGGLTDVALAHYAGSTDVHEGILQMWVPLSPAAQSIPGFTVRTEIRGTSALPGGGSGMVMGADEVYIHVTSQPPLPRNAVVRPAVGVALDDSAIGERPTDPGADDLSHLLPPLLSPAIRDAVENLAPGDFPGDWACKVDWDPCVQADAHLNSMGFTGGLESVDLAPVDGDASQLVVKISGTLFPDLTVSPHAWGVETILSGDCRVTAQLPITVDLGVTFGVDATGTKPVIHVKQIGSTVGMDQVRANGTLVLAYLSIIPGLMDCSAHQSDIGDAIRSEITDKLAAFVDPATAQKIEATFDTSAPVAVADLANGPINGTFLSAPADPAGDPDGVAGIVIANAKYHQSVSPVASVVPFRIWNRGIDAMADLAVTDAGSARFPYSFQPGFDGSFIGAVHQRTRPATDPSASSASSASSSASSAPVAKTPAPTAAPMPSVGATATATFSRAVMARPVDPTGPSDPPPTTQRPTTTTTSTARPPVTITGPTATFVGPGGSGTAGPTPTDFDIGLVVNGATVNELSRAYAAGSRDGTGFLDIETKVLQQPDGRGGIPTHVRPAVAPMYLPTAPTGWPADGPVRFLVPSLNIQVDGAPFGFSSDVMVGANATIDTATNHLAAVPAPAVAARVRFLHLVPGVNQASDPSASPADGSPSSTTAAATEVAKDVSQRVAGILGGIEVPNLSTLLANAGQPSMMLSHLSLSTVGGGDLGIYFDVDPNSTTVGVSVAFNGPADAEPTSFTATATPGNYPDDGHGYMTTWTVSDPDTGAVKFRSAAPEPGVSRTFGKYLMSGHVDDKCTGETSASVKVTARVTRANVSNSGTTSATSEEWQGPAISHFCGDDDPLGSRPGP